MSIFKLNFGRTKQNHSNVFRFNDNNKSNECDNNTFARIHRNELTKCLNDARVCKLLGVDNIFTAGDIRIPKLSKDEYVHVMSHLYTVYLAIGNAEKAYTTKFDNEYREVLDEYISATDKDESVKQNIQSFFSVKEITSHFDDAMKSTDKVTDIAMTEYNKDGGKNEIKDFIALANSQLDMSLGVMMLTNAFSGFSYVV